MAGPWLYVITSRSGSTFDLKDGEVDVSLENYRKLVRNGRLVEDDRWGGKSGIRRNKKNVRIGDELYIYTGDDLAGIIGYARIRDIEPSGAGCQLVLDFDLRKCRALLRNPISAVVVRSWKLNLQGNIINLSPVEKKLRSFLSKDFFARRQLVVEDKDWQDWEFDEAASTNEVKFRFVSTDDPVALRRQRRGQDRLREFAIRNYGRRCAVCDITDPGLLVASHVVGWAEYPKHRGDLANVICLCRFHDALFERGYWALDDKLQLIKSDRIESTTVGQVLAAMKMFRLPVSFPPCQSYIRLHRKKAGFF